MMVYLTGAQASLVKSPSNPQSDPSKSLGGYISSTQVPNAALNSLFDLLSSHTLEKRQKETIAIALINQFDYPVCNVELKIVTDDNHEAIFKVAAVSVNKNDYLMESIGNRYQEPLNAEFYTASFYRAAVEINIITAAAIGEEIALYPFNVIVNVLEAGMEGTWNAFEEAFSNDETYTVKRVSETKFRIERRDETVLESPIQCSYIATEGFTASFSGDLKNKADNTVLVKDIFNPHEAIGIWIQRQIKKNDYATDEEMINEFIQKYVRNDSEEIELIISYDLVTEENFSPEYNPEEYS